MAAIRVVLAEDHTLVRTGIRALVNEVPEAEVVGEAADGREALRLVDERRPDVVIMDITMPELNGFEATARIVKTHPGVKVLVLSMHAEDEYVLRALRSGAGGYLLKDATSRELEHALRAVAGGNTYLSPAVSKSVVEQLLSREEPPSPLERLTPRHREILQLISEGHSTKEIAAKLQLSVKTVETHRSELMKRLDIHDVPGLVRYAIRSGLVSLEQ